VCFFEMSSLSCCNSNTGYPDVARTIDGLFRTLESEKAKKQKEKEANE
jgi:hypothetical protein